MIGADISHYRPVDTNGNSSDTSISTQLSEASQSHSQEMSNLQSHNDNSFAGLNNSHASQEPGQPAATSAYTEDNLNQQSVEQLKHIIAENHYLAPVDYDNKEALIQSILHPVNLIGSLNDVPHANIIINVTLTDTNTQLPEVLRILREAVRAPGPRGNTNLCINEPFRQYAPPMPTIVANPASISSQIAANASMYTPSHMMRTPQQSHMMRTPQSRPPIRAAHQVDLSSYQPPTAPIRRATYQPQASYQSPSNHSENGFSDDEQDQAPRKRARISIEEKIEMVKRLKMGLKPTDRPIAPRTLRNIIQKADQIEARANMLTEEERKHRKNFFRTKTSKVEQQPGDSFPSV